MKLYEMHFARFQITAAAAEYFNRIRQVAKRIANIRLTKQKKTDTWQIVRMPVSCFYLLVFQKRSVIMLRFRSSLHELLTVLFERLHREFQLLQRKSHLLRCTERKLPGRKPDRVSCYNGKLYHTGCVTYRKTCNSKNEWFAREAFFNSGTAEHCHRNKSENKAAGRSEKSAESTAHAA